LQQDPRRENFGVIAERGSIQFAESRQRGSIPACAGIGLRFAHHQAVVDSRPDIGWFEVHSENYIGGGAARAYLDTIRRDYPIALHGVGLSIGSAEALDRAHLRRVREVVERFEPGLVSEHLSWSIVDGAYLADLLPLPMTEEALAVVCCHVEQTQSYLRRRILIENPSSYLQYVETTIPEWEFIAEVAKRSGCGILCDVNNIYVSSCNHGWDPSAYLAALPADAVGEIHLAGHTVRRLDNGRALRIDDHGARVSADVWTLYEDALARFGPRPTLVEWDNNIPPLGVLLDEAAHADALLHVTEGADRARAA
jgi:uncharacterized protein